MCSSQDSRVVTLALEAWISNRFDTIWHLIWFCLWQEILKYLNNNCRHCEEKKKEQRVKADERRKTSVWTAARFAGAKDARGAYPEFTACNSSWNSLRMNSCRSLWKLMSSGWAGLGNEWQVAALDMQTLIENQTRVRQYTWITQMTLNSSICTHLGSRFHRNLFKFKTTLLHVMYSS